MKETIFSISDQTNEEQYWTLGYFKTFEEALKIVCDRGHELGMDWNQENGFVKIVIKEREFGLKDPIEVYVINFRQEWLDEKTEWKGEIILG